MAPLKFLSIIAGLALLIGCLPAAAGVINPRISVIGQPYLVITDDQLNPDRDRLCMEPGETELVFDDYLNPYSRGYITLSLTEEGLELEEGYFALMRGLPGALTLKGGKWRQDFGKLNAQHPHTYPFFDRFHMLATYLPGDESLNDTGLELSERLPAPGETSLVASAVWLQGTSFRREREASGAPNDPLAADEAGDHADESRPAAIGRLSAFTLLGERSGLEYGLSAASGTNNAAASTRTTAVGADAKAKLWTSERSYLVLQCEVMRLDRQDANWNATLAGYSHETVKPWGWYLFGDYNWNLRWNLGASCERYQRDNAEKVWDAAVGVFAGFALMEETTAFRLGWERFQVGPAVGEPQPDAVNTLSMRIIYSMGPHRAHEF